MMNVGQVYVAMFNICIYIVQHDVVVDVMMWCGGRRPSNTLIANKDGNETERDRDEQKTHHRSAASESLIDLLIASC